MNIKNPVTYKSAILIYFVNTITNQCIPFLVLMWLTGMVPIGEMGKFAMAQVFGSVSAGLCFLGLPLVFERNFFQCKDDAEISSLLYTLASFTGFLVILFSLVIPYLAGVFEALSFGISVEWLLLGHLSASSNQLLTFFLHYFKNKEMPRFYARLTTSQTIVSNLITVIGVVYFSTGAAGILLGQTVARFIVVTCICIVLWRRNFPGFRFQLLKEAWIIALPLGPKILLGVTGAQFDRYIVGVLESLGNLGVYNLGKQFGLFGFNATSALDNVYGPKVYKSMLASDSEETRRYIGSYLSPFFYLSTGMIILLASFSFEVLWLFSKPEYWPASTMIAIVCPYYALLFFGKQNQLLTAKKTHLISLNFFLSVLITIPLTYWFARRFGTIGAAWGTLLSGTIVTFISQYQNQRVYPIIWEIKKLLAVFSVLVVLCFLVVSSAYIEISYPVLLTSKVALLVVYLLLGLHFHFISLSSLYKRFSP